MLTITNEDNMDLMSRYADKHFDLAIVDPPYGLNVITGRSFGDPLRKDGTIRHGIDKRNGAKIVRKASTYIKKDWDKVPPNEEYFKELMRVSKNQNQTNMENKELPQSLIDYLNNKYPINEETGINDKHTLLMFRKMVTAGYNLCLSEKQISDEFVKTYDDYIKLLGEELDDLVGLATVHGWKSKRFEQGKLMREKIVAIKESLPTFVQPPKESDTFLIKNPHCKMPDSCSNSLSKKCICPK